jgi:nucleoside-diphosphate-sugar epimerase
MTRTPGKASHLQALGASVAVADVIDAGAVKEAVMAARPEAVIDGLTALPKRGPLRYRDMDRTNVIRTRGTANVLQACIAAGCRRLVAESIVFVYGFGDLGVEAITEDRLAASSAPDPRLMPPINAVRVHEERVLDASQAEKLEGIVVRLGAFYGVGAGTELMVRMLRLRAPVLLGGGDGLTPWMHVENGAAALVAAVERGVQGEVYNAADDEPASLRDFVVELARVTDTPKPSPVRSGWLVWQRRT